MGGRTTDYTVPISYRYHGITYTKSVEYLNFVTREWKQCPDLPCNLSNCKAVYDYVSQKCIIIGVQLDDNSKFTIENSKVSIFDPEKGLAYIQGDLKLKQYDIVTVLL